MKPEAQRPPEVPERRIHNRPGKNTERDRQLPAVQLLAQVGIWECDIPFNAGEGWRMRKEGSRFWAGRQVQRTGIFILLCDDGQELAPAPAVTTACFRIAQEALTTAIRHANAGKIQIGLSRDHDAPKIESCPGRGTAVRARFPLTLAATTCPATEGRGRA